MFEKWVVSVHSGYDDVNFDFGSSEEAIMFAKMANLSIRQETNTKGELVPSKVKIFAESIISKEENTNGNMELSEG